MSDINNIMRKSYDKFGVFSKTLYRKEVSRLSSMANKRLRRLEKNDLRDSPAYKAIAENGGAKFGVRGKSFVEVQKEYARLNQFLNAKTSTIRGVNATLKEMAKNTGIKYDTMEGLKRDATKFFSLGDKIQQYLDNVEDAGSAIGYQKIWDVINEYVQEGERSLDDAEDNIDDLIGMVQDLLDHQTQPDAPLDLDLKNDWVIL